MKGVAVINQKGGVAKTTTAVNLMRPLVQLGLRGLLIDLDQQAQSTRHCGLSPASPRDHSPLYDVLIRGFGIPERAVTTLWGFDVLASSRDLAGAETMMSGIATSTWALKEALELQPVGSYDFVLFDCPPSLGPLSTAALIAASSFLVPMTMQQAPLEGFADLLDTVAKVRRRDNRGLVMAGVLGCNTPRGSTLSQEVRHDIRSQCGAEAMFAREIRYSEYVARGFKVQKPVAVYAPGSIGDEDYQAAAEELLAREVVRAA